MIKSLPKLTSTFPKKLLRVKLTHSILAASSRRSACRPVRCPPSGDTTCPRWCHSQTCTSTLRPPLALGAPVSDCPLEEERDTHTHTHTHTPFFERGTDMFWEGDKHVLRGCSFLCLNALGFICWSECVSYLCEYFGVCSCRLAGLQFGSRRV